MASIGELERRIASCQREIEECRQEIRKAEEKIAELNQLRGRIGGLSTVFDEAHMIRKNKLYQVVTALEHAKRYSNNIIGSYHDRTNDMLTGSEYKQAVKGLWEADDAAYNEIQRQKRIIEQYRNRIAALEREISSCEHEIAEIEREEAERAEEEARAAAAAAASQKIS